MADASLRYLATLLSIPAQCPLVRLRLRTKRLTVSSCKRLDDLVSRLCSKASEQMPSADARQFASREARSHPRPESTRGLFHAIAAREYPRSSSSRTDGSLVSRACSYDASRLALESRQTTCGQMDS